METIIKNIVELKKHIKANGDSQIVENPAFDTILDDNIVKKETRNIIAKKIDDDNYKYEVIYNYNANNFESYNDIKSLSIYSGNGKISLIYNIIEKRYNRGDFANLGENDRVPNISASRQRVDIGTEANEIVCRKLLEDVTEYERAQFPGAHEREIGRIGVLEEQHYDEYGIENVRVCCNNTTKLLPGSYNYVDKDRMFIGYNIIGNNPDEKWLVRRKSIDTARVIKHNKEKLVFSGDSLINNYNFPGRGFESLDTIVMYYGINQAAYQEIAPAIKEDYINDLKHCNDKQKEGLLNKWWCNREKYRYSSSEDKSFVCIDEEVKLQGRNR